jgi:predicted MFS family arabinose efflux permease
MAEIASERPTRIVRGGATWYCYLLIGLFLYFLNIQGNIVPFLKSELDLSYGTVSLHASAIAVGGIAVGAVGHRFIALFGRDAILRGSAIGMAAGAFLLCVAPNAIVSIASCAIIGIAGAFIATASFAALADIHREQRQTAFNESAVIAYVFGAAAPLLTGIALAAEFGWRSAVLFGVLIAAAIVAVFARTRLPAQHVNTSGGGRLPASYWVYWCSVCLAVALEFCVLLWAPEFLEKVIGLSRAGAAGAAAAFVVGMLIGRTAGAVLASEIGMSSLYAAELMIILAGFGLYWGTGHPLAAIAGLFVLGLGVALLYPLSVGLALGAATGQSDKASARIMIAFGVALLIVPAFLGTLADAFGLSRAYLLMPLLVGLAALTFTIGRTLEARSTPASAST